MKAISCTDCPWSASLRPAKKKGHLRSFALVEATRYCKEISLVVVRIEQQQGIFICCHQVVNLAVIDDDNKVKMVRKPGKKQEENHVGCTGEGER